MTDRPIIGGMSRTADPLGLRWAFFATALVGLFGSALLLGMASTRGDLLFLVGVTMAVSALFLPGVEERIGDDRLQFGAVFFAMGVALLVLTDGRPGPAIFVLAGLVFVGLCLRDRRFDADDARVLSR